MTRRTVWTVDVWHAPPGLLRDTLPARDWRRYRIAALSATQAELIACQWAATVYGNAVGSVVIDPL